MSSFESVISTFAGRTLVSFQLHEAPGQQPTNDQLISLFRQLIQQQQLNLIDLNRCLLRTMPGSVAVGRNIFETRLAQLLLVKCNVT
jgi:hypothetical protein